MGERCLHNSIRGTKISLGLLVGGRVKRPGLGHVLKITLWFSYGACEVLRGRLRVWSIAGYWLGRGFWR